MDALLGAFSKVMGYGSASAGAVVTESVQQGAMMTHAEVSETIVRNIREIARRNKEGLSAPTNEGLREGIYYGNEYCEALLTLSARGDPWAQEHFKTLYGQGAFYHGALSSKYFMHVKEPMSPSGLAFNGYRIAREVREVSRALDEFSRGWTLLDCGGTCQLAYLQAIRTALGDRKFDVLLTGSGPTPLTIYGFDMTTDKVNILSRLLREEEIDSPRRLGQIVVINNAESYSRKHAQGEAARFISICTDATKGQERYVALGFPSEGLTLEGVGMFLLEEYNKQPIPVSDILPIDDALLPLSDEAKANKQLGKKAFIREGGGKVIAVWELDEGKFQEFQHSPHQREFIDSLSPLGISH